MIGTRLSHYQIVEQLGAGGMGVVFRARDEHLDRDVAIKVLPPEALGDETRRLRFRREALAISRLNHPAIATVYAFETVGRTDYLVMEYVPGVTLRQKLEAGPLEEHEIVTLGVQIADALAAAHERAVIHRDLKPGNIVVTPRGTAKVLDFGLAQLLETPRDHAAAAALTDTATAAGTLPYMAPEQLLGDPLDARTDLYALGAVLYEMATGRPPHEARLSTALVYEIVHRLPPAPRSLRRGLSAALEQVILRALEKQPERRFASAAEMADALRRLASSTGAVATGLPPGAASPISSVAVLPLENLSGDPAQEFFADGMTEALISNLAQISALRVISRTSVMQYKGARLPLPEIARSLNVDAVVEGSAMRSGGRVRVTAQLVEARTDRSLWARSYERDLGDVLTLQSEVARSIAEEIRVKVTPEEQRRLADQRPVNPEAHLAYLKGRFQWNRRSREGLRAALEFFEQAIAIDPAFALAYAGIADCWNVLADQAVAPPDEAARRSRSAALRSLELQEAQAEAYTSLGYVRYFFDWDWTGAEQEFRRAIGINPSYATAHQWYSTLLTALGRAGEAIAEARRALEIDPLSMIIYTAVGDAYFFARRYDEAAESYRKALEMDPAFVPARTDLARVFEQQGRFDEALAEYTRAAEIAKGEPIPSSGMAHLHAAAGRPEEALAIVRQLEELSTQRYVSSYSIGSVYAGMGEVDRAFEWLEKAFENHDQALVWLKVHPRLDSLRGDPRFAALVARMRFPA